MATEGPSAPRDPLNDEGVTTAAWTTVNVSEAVPGIPTPITWTFYAPAIEHAFLTAFGDLGLLSRDERRDTVRPLDERSVAIFLGHPALNLDRFRMMADRSPGGSGDALEEQMFGSVRVGRRSGDGRDRRRYPAIALRAPGTAGALPVRLKRSMRETDRWWRDAVRSPVGDADGARRLLADASQRLKPAFRLQLTASMVAQGLFDAITRLATSAGRPGLVTDLVTGYRSMAENAVLTDLWRVSRNHLSTAAFVISHGYHGPLEGELASRSWREDRGEVERLAKAYAATDDTESPERAVARRAEARQRAERDLIAATPWLARPALPALFRMARLYIPYREAGKATFLRVVDVARHATRALGQQAVDDGFLDEPDDVLYLTVEELLGSGPDGARALVAWRRRRRADYLDLALPEVWIGRPEALAPAMADSPSSLTGLAVSAGIVEARARVVVDPCARDEMLPGEVLVCHTTDPGWAPLFFLAGGVVIDVGGPLSHGAIVARELGIPCVINTKTGTEVIKTGDLVRIDGTGGTVDVIDRV